LLLCIIVCLFFFFFFQAEDGIRDGHVTGVQTCALPIYCGPKIRVGCAAAAAAAHGHVHLPEALLPEAVHVGGERVAGLAAGLEPRRVQRILEPAAPGGERALRAAVFITAAGAPLGALEVRQNVAIAPPCRALPLPALEVERIAAHVDEPVDRGGAAEHLAARRVQPPAAEVRLGLGVVAPV